MATTDIESNSDWTDFISNTAQYFSNLFEIEKSTPAPKNVAKVSKKATKMAARKQRLDEEKAARLEKLSLEKVARRELVRVKREADKEVKREADKEEKVRKLNEKLEQRHVEKKEAIASLIQEKLNRIKVKKSEKKGADLRQLVKKVEKHKIMTRKGKTVCKRPKRSLFELKKVGKVKEENVLNSSTFISGVPPSRTNEITALTKSQRRQYKADFTEYFRDHQSVDLKSVDGEIGTNPKSTRDLIVTQTSKILLERDTDMDAKQKAALQEVCRIPNVEKQYPCKDCSKSFNSTNGLFTHHKTIHQKRLEKNCGLCKIRFESQAAHRIHRKEFHPRKKNDNVCPICEKAFNSEYTRDKHLKSIHDDAKFKCKFCEKTFSWIENQRRHIRQVHTDLRPFQCTKCQQFFNDSGNLKRHIRSKHLMKRIQCSFEACEKICFDKGDLSRHVAEKHSEPLICKICEKDFQTFYGLSIHKNKNHAEVPREYPCHQCSLTFLTPQDRSGHESQVHRKEKVSTDFKCRYCPEKFASKSARLGHYSTHPGEKYKFSCLFCGAKKPTEIRLNLHEKECYKTKMEEAQI